MSALNIMDLGIASSNATGELVELLRRRRINSSILELAPWALSEPTCRQHRRTLYKSQLSAANLLLVNEASPNYSWFVLPQLELQKAGCMHFSYNAAKICPFVHQYLLVQPKIKFQILTSSLSNRVIMRTDESFCRLSPPQEPTRPWSVNQKRNMSHIINTNGTL